MCYFLNNQEKRVAKPCKNSRAYQNMIFGGKIKKNLIKITELFSGETIENSINRCLSVHAIIVLFLEELE